MNLSRPNAPCLRPSSWRLAAGALTLATLAACGGGGDSAGIDDPGAAVAQWQLALTQDSSGQQRVALWDPARPAATRQEFTVDAGMAATVAAETVDAATGTRTVVGAAQLLYVQGGRLYRLALRDVATPQGVQVSSETSVCALDSAQALRADGTLAAVALKVTGSGGACDTDRTVRSDADSTVAAVGATGERLLSVLPDASGNAVALMMAVDGGSGSERLALRNPDLSNPRALAGQPASGGGANAVMAWARGPAGRAWVATGGQVFQLDWFDGQPTLGGTPLLTLQEDATRGLAAGQRALSDSDGALYLTDGQDLRRWRQGTATTLLTLPGSAVFTGLGLSSARVVYSTGVDAMWRITEVASLPKTGGTPTTLSTGAASTWVSLEAMGGDTAVVRSTGSLGLNLLTVPADGGSGASLSGLSAGLRWSAQRAAGVPPVATGLFECVATASGCTMRVRTLAGTVEATLGDLGTTGLSSAWGEQTTGLPTAWVVGNGTGTTDAWSWTPTLPTQLDRITSHL